MASKHYVRLARAAARARRGAAQIAERRPTRESVMLEQAAVQVERELWTAYVLALGEDFTTQGGAPAS